MSVPRTIIGPSLKETTDYLDSVIDKWPDIVIPLGTGSKLKNFELRMCLRSIEKNITGYRNIFIVGECPEFLQNITHIPVTDLYKESDRNIEHKIMVACNHPDLSETFLFGNDDHFILKPFQADKFPFYYSGDLGEYIRKRGNDEYGKRAQNTYSHLKEQGLPTNHFDIHTPILYNKEKFINLVSALDWNQKTYIIKSLYANSLKIEGEQIEDHKYNNPPTKDVGVYSTYPNLRASVTRFLTEQFPKPSKYERII